MAVSNGRIIDRRRTTAARPSARPARSLVLIVGLALASLAGSLVAGVNTRPAAACSCAGAEVSWFVKNTEAGFIGTLEDRAEGRGNGDEWAQVVNRFSVEAWTHGDLDDAVIDVWAPQGGGACGLEIPVGQTAAVFIDRNDGQWTSSLCATLDAGQVRAAGLDVTDPEPLDPDHTLLHRENVVVTPHIASSTEVGRDRMLSMAIEQALQALDGDRPAHLVNPAVWRQ